MKDYEKLYKEALERARKLKEDPQQVFYEHSPKEGETIADYIFPELKESEDEKVRKEIISALKFANDTGVYDKHIAWLEKQGDINRRIQEEIEKQTRQQWKPEMQGDNVSGECNDYSKGDNNIK